MFTEQNTFFIISKNQNRHTYNLLTTLFGDNQNCFNNASLVWPFALFAYPDIGLIFVQTQFKTTTGAAYNIQEITQNLTSSAVTGKGQTMIINKTSIQPEQLSAKVNKTTTTVKNQGKFKPLDTKQCNNNYQIL